jgi:thiosulfate/3-mercaptopyruvate sulfurtransferase
MKTRILSVIAVTLLFAGWPAILDARDISPIVSADWLEENLSNPKLVVLDIRKVEEYRVGHIPGAVSAYYRTWAYSKKGNREEVPEQDDLFDAIGDAGIRPYSLIVVVCSSAYCYHDVEAARVACTLEYAGLKNVGILNGGHEEWTRGKRSISIKFEKPKKTTYTGTLNKNLLADKRYVKDHLGKAVFVDVREQAFVRKQDRIPGSVNLPITEAFTKSGMFKPVSELNDLAVKTVGTDKSKAIVTYCDTGRCCPTWAFIFRKVLGYENVRVYDGGMEEWSREPEAPITR